MNKLSSIKEVRLSKGLTIEQLAAKLKINSVIIEKIENDEENQVNENDIVNLFEGKDML